LRGRTRCSSKLSKGIGDRVELGADTLKVVGIVNGSTALAGTPNVFLTTEGAQKVSFASQPVASSIGVTGNPTAAPPGYKVVTQDDAVADMLRPMQSSHSAISFLAILLWIVAALIVGSVIYLSALERVRDFAVFKAVGVSTRSVMAGLALQAVIVAVVAALVGGVLSFVLGPTFPMKVVIPMSALALLPVIGSRRPRREHRGAAARGHRRSRTRVRRALTVPGLEIRDLVVEYASGGYAVRPIDGLDLDVPAGNLAILLGPSGCGKTTLLSCLGGIRHPRRAASASVTRRSPVSTAGPWPTTATRSASCSRRSTPFRA
jgi:hypothetical protein